MRWIRPEHGATRRNTRFLWLRLTIGQETRWLERATWEEAWWDPGQMWLEAENFSEEMRTHVEKYYLAVTDGHWTNQRWIADQ